MEHLQYYKSGICSLGQILLSQNRLSKASEVMNLLGYWGEEYGEQIFQRIKYILEEEQFKHLTKNSCL